MARRSVSAGLGLCGLDERIGCFDAAIGELGIEGVEDALPVRLDGAGDVFDGFEAAAASPAVPAFEQGLGLGGAVGAAEDLTQGLFDAEGAMGFEVEALEVVELVDLVLAPGLLVLEPDVAGATQRGGGLDLLAAHLVDCFVDQLDDVELVEGDLGPRAGVPRCQRELR